MLIESNAKEYKHKFPFNPHPYISEGFIELVAGKADRIVRLMEDKQKVSIGLIAGIRDLELKSPISAPFGGFHFRHSNILISEIEDFLSQLISYSFCQNLTKIELTLPPFIYHHSFSAKMFSALLRNGFSMNIPEITNWIDLRKFSGEFSDCNARNSYSKSLQRNLSFYEVFKKEEKEAAFRLVCQNRARFNRPIYMEFNDLMEMSKLWPVDFFHVLAKDGDIVATAICYRGHPKIVQAIFWGDNEKGRCLCSMNFCSLNLWNHYKKMGFNFVDLGISTEYGIPNIGLIRFKENLDCISGLRFTMSLTIVNDHLL